VQLVRENMYPKQSKKESEGAEEKEGVRSGKRIEEEGGLDGYGKREERVRNVVRTMDRRSS